MVRCWEGGLSKMSISSRDLGLACLLDDQTVSAGNVAAFQNQESEQYF